MSGLLALAGREQAFPKLLKAAKPERTPERHEARNLRGTNYPSKTDMALSHVNALEAKISSELDNSAPDWDMVEKLGTELVEGSTNLREISMVENRPAPPRYEPVTSRLDVNEARTYDGLEAGELSFTAELLFRLKGIIGLKQVKARMARLPRKILQSLSTYVKVKRLVARLEAAVDAPETAMTPRVKITAPVKTRETFRWRVSPQSHYNWKISESVRGYDVRRTSLYWLKLESAVLRRRLYAGYIKSITKLCQ